MESSFETEEELETQYRRIGAIHEYEPPPAGATSRAHANWKVHINRKLDRIKRHLQEDNELKERCVEAGKPDAYEPGCLGESSPEDRRKRFRRINTAIAQFVKRKRRQLEEDNELKERCVEKGKPDAYEPGCPTSRPRIVEKGFDGSIQP